MGNSSKASSDKSSENGTIVDNEGTSSVKLNFVVISQIIIKIAKNLIFL